jgi:hypothetical protein
MPFPLALTRFFTVFPAIATVCSRSGPAGPDDFRRPGYECADHRPLPHADFEGRPAPRRFS